MTRAARNRDDDQVRDLLAAEEFGVPAPDPQLHADDAHDVLAAEEFGMPAPDPALHADEPRDVLAAEEFGVPAGDSAPAPVPVSLAVGSTHGPRVGTGVRAAGAAVCVTAVAMLLRRRRT